jgi:hypothetical protein
MLTNEMYSRIFSINKYILSHKSNYVERQTDGKNN